MHRCAFQHVFTMCIVWGPRSLSSGACYPVEGECARDTQYALSELAYAYHTRMIRNTRIIRSLYAAQPVGHQI
jgi:hypothetical protein